MSRSLLVLEAGGTTLRAARFDESTCTLLRRRTARTPSARAVGDDLHTAVLRALSGLAEDVLAGGAPHMVALAYPGPIDERGNLLAAPTVTGPDGPGTFSLLDACRARWPGASVHTENDLTAAGFRYVAAGLRDFAILTVGSGIGHKVFSSGRPQVGPGGRGGELGHLRLDLSPDAPLCDCGGRGHLGALASGRGTVALVRRRARADPAAFCRSVLARQVALVELIDGPTVAAAYLAGDDFTREAVGAAVAHLGQGLAAIHLDTGVEQIVLIGGFAQALGEDYRQQVVVAAAAACWQVGQDWNAIVRLGFPDDDSALLGLGLLLCGAIELSSV